MFEHKQDIILLNISFYDPEKKALCIRTTPGWVNTPMTEFSFLGKLF